MESDVANEYKKIENLISEKEFLEKCQKLHRLIGVTVKNTSRVNNKPEGFLWLHDKNDFPLKGFLVGFGFSNLEVAKILVESIIQDVDLFNEDFSNCLILDLENYFGEPIKFITKDKIYDKELLDKFSKELIDYTLGYYNDDYSLIKSFDKTIADFNSIDGFLNYLKEFINEYPSLNWALSEYNNHKEDYSTDEDIIILIEKVNDLYNCIFGSEITHQEATEFMDDLMGDYHKIHEIYDFWDQYGVNFE